MKKITVLLAVCIAASIGSKAQCDKTMKWTSSKSDFLDTAGNFQRSNAETVDVTTTPKKISIVRNNSDKQLMSGDVTSFSCNWKDKKNGKASIKAVLVEPGGKTRNATITIEEVNGKTTILLEAPEENTKIRLNVDSYEEVN